MAFSIVSSHTDGINTKTANAADNEVLFHLKSVQVSTTHSTLLDVDDLTLYKHKLTSFIGPNGAGKSTLLHTLLNKNTVAGLTRTGQIDSPIMPIDALIRQGKIAWVGQHERYELPLTALEYTLLGVSPQLSWYQRPSQHHISQAERLFKDFELQNLKEARVQTLSGGEKQRLSIIRALMQDTDIIMLDEPTNHLDIRHQRFLLSYLKKLVMNRQKTVITVLHDLTHAYRYSDAVILMDKGHIKHSGNPDTVMTTQNLSPIYQVDINTYDTDSGRLFV